MHLYRHMSEDTRLMLPVLWCRLFEQVSVFIWICYLELPLAWLSWTQRY